MFNRSIKATRWLEHYLLTAREHRDLEQFVLIEGRAKGFSAKLLRQVAADPRFERKDGWWGLTDLRVEALEIRARLAQGAWRPTPQTQPSLLVVEGVDEVMEMLVLRPESRPAD